MKKILLLVLFCDAFIFVKPQSWTAVPGWQSSYGSPASIIKFQGDLWASSHLGIYKYTGSVWQLTSSAFGISDARCLYTDGTDLYAGGLFTFSSDKALVIKWDGSQWIPIAYTDNTASGVWIGAILKTPTKLYAGGFFNSIGASPSSLSNFGLWAVFDGSSWVQPFAVTDGSCLSGIESFSVIGDSIYVAGGFSELVNIWTPATFRFKEGGNLSSLDGYGFCYIGRNYQAFQNQLFIGGTRRSDYALIDVGFAKRNGNTWLTVDNSMRLNNTRLTKMLGKVYIAGVPNGGLNNALTDICSYDGFSFVDEGVGVSFPNGSNVYPSISAMFADTLSNKLYVAGNFMQSDGNVADYFAVKTFSIVPVRLYGFDARLSSVNEVMLSWQDQTPMDQTRFEVQMSKDGTNFVKIGSVRGNDYSGNYSFEYKAPTCGRYYFRLSYDLKYSDIRYVDVPCPGPKIVAGKQSLTIDTKLPGTLILTSTPGQNVGRTVLPHGYSQIPVLVSPGIYVAQFIDADGKAFVQKVFIQ